MKAPFAFPFFGSMQIDADQNNLNLHTQNPASLPPSNTAEDFLSFATSASAQSDALGEFDSSSATTIPEVENQNKNIANDKTHHQVPPMNSIDCRLMNTNSDVVENSCSNKILGSNKSNLLISESISNSHSNHMPNIDQSSTHSQSELQTIMLDPAVAVTLEFYAKRVLCFALAARPQQSPSNTSPSASSNSPNINFQNTGHMTTSSGDTATAVAAAAYSVFSSIVSTHLGVPFSSFLPANVVTSLPFPLALAAQLARLVGLVVLVPPALRSTSYASAAEAFTGRPGTPGDVKSQTGSTNQSNSAAEHEIKNFSTESINQLQFGDGITHQGEKKVVVKSTSEISPTFPPEWFCYDATQDLVLALRTQAYLLGPEALANPTEVAARAGPYLSAPGSVQFPERLKLALEQRSYEIFTVVMDEFGEIPIQLTHAGFLDDAKNALRFLVATYVDPCAVLENLLHNGFRGVIPTLSNAVVAAAAAAAAAVSAQTPQSAQMQLQNLNSLSNLHQSNVDPHDIARRSLAPNETSAVVGREALNVRDMLDGENRSQSNICGAITLNSSRSRSKRPRNYQNNLKSDAYNIQLDESNRPRYSDRNIWSKEEEDALEEGMREFGPRYSTILAVYGPSGTRSRVLEKRGQIQLKDKARNMRLRRERAGVDPGPFIHGIKYSSHAERNSGRRLRRQGSDDYRQDNRDDPGSTGSLGEEDSEIISSRGDVEGNIRRDVSVTHSGEIDQRLDVVNNVEQEVALLLQQIQEHQNTQMHQQTQQFQQQQPLMSDLNSNQIDLEAQLKINEHHQLLLHHHHQQQQQQQQQNPNNLIQNANNQLLGSELQGEETAWGSSNLY